MRNKILWVLLLSSCASTASVPVVPECELGVSRPLSLKTKRGEVYVERNTLEGCVIEERLVWGKSSVPLTEPEWRAGALSLWRGQVALDLYKFFDGHPLECKTWVYKFAKNKLRMARKSKTCGP
jgi:hypothetical protein